MISTTAYSTCETTADGYDVRAGAMLRHQSSGKMKKVGAVDTDTGRPLVRKRGRPSPKGPEYTPLENLNQYETVNATVWEEVDV